MHRKWAKEDNSDSGTGDSLWQSYQDKRHKAKNLIRQNITEMRVNRSIDIANKRGPSCRHFWKVLRGSNKHRNKDDVNCIKVPSSEDIICDRKMMNLTIMQYWANIR